MNIRRILLAVLPLLICGAGAWHFLIQPPTPRVELQPEPAGVAVAPLPVEQMFYGRVLDQSGAPVAGARVRVTPLASIPGRSSETQEHQKTSARGHFRFTHSLLEPDLGITLEKDGYESRPPGMPASYIDRAAGRAPPGTEPTEPVVIQLWKKQGADTMIHYPLQARFPVNAEAQCYNLLSSQAVVAPHEGGSAPDTDLIVSVWRDPRVLPAGARGFAWRVTLEAPGGGIIRAEPGSYPYLAPEAGYVPRLEFAQAAQPQAAVEAAAAGTTVAATWQEGVQGNFIVSLRGGKYYGRLALRIGPQDDRAPTETMASIAGEVFVNPTGSRNLEAEFTEGKMIGPQR